MSDNKKLYEAWKDKQIPRTLEDVEAEQQKIVDTFCSFPVDREEAKVLLAMIKKLGKLEEEAKADLLDYRTPDKYKYRSQAELDLITAYRELLESHDTQLADIDRLLDRVEPFNDEYRASCKRLTEGMAETEAVVSLLDLTALAFAYKELREIYPKAVLSPTKED